MAKYGNKKVIVDGMTFDSRKEYNRWLELKMLERSGEIQNLSRQVECILIPPQFEVTGYTKTGKPVKKCVERAVKYVADFQYTENGEIVVEDTKGFKTKDYIIKRKLMRYIHGIRVKEI